MPSSRAAGPTVPGRAPAARVVEVVFRARDRRVVAAERVQRQRGPARAQSLAAGFVAREAAAISSAAASASSQRPSAATTARATSHQRVDSAASRSLERFSQRQPAGAVAALERDGSEVGEVEPPCRVAEAPTLVRLDQGGDERLGVGEVRRAAAAACPSARR